MKQKISLLFTVILSLQFSLGPQALAQTQAQECQAVTIGEFPECAINSQNKNCLEDPGLRGKRQDCQIQGAAEDINNDPDYASNFDPKNQEAIAGIGYGIMAMGILIAIASFFLADTSGCIWASDILMNTAGLLQSMSDLAELLTNHNRLVEIGKKVTKDLESPDQKNAQIKAYEYFIAKERLAADMIRIKIITYGISTGLLYLASGVAIYEMMYTTGVGAYCPPGSTPSPASLILISGKGRKNLAKVHPVDIDDIKVSPKASGLDGATQIEAGSVGRGRSSGKVHPEVDVEDIRVSSKTSSLDEAGQGSPNRIETDISDAPSGGLRKNPAEWESTDALSTLPPLPKPKPLGPKSKVKAWGSLDEMELAPLKGGRGADAKMEMENFNIRRTEVELDRLYGKKNYMKNDPNVSAKELDEINASIAKNEMDIAFFKAAKNKESVIIVRPINEDAFRLIGDGAATKNMHIKSKSCTKGPCKGFIPVEAEFSKAADLKGSQVEILDKYNKYTKNAINEGYAAPVPLKIGDDSVVVRINPATGTREMVVVKKGGELPGDEPFMVLGDPNTKRPMTADADLFAVGRRKSADLPPDEVLTDPKVLKEHGGISKNEKQIMEMVNEEFISRSTTGSGARGRRTSQNIVHHGPDNRFGLNPIDFPLTIYHPNGKKIIINEKGGEELLKKYFKEFNSQGYDLRPSEHWRWKDSEWMPDPSPPKKLPKDSRDGLKHPFAPGAFSPNIFPINKNRWTPPKPLKMAGLPVKNKPLDHFMVQWVHENKKHAPHPDFIPFHS